MSVYVDNMAAPFGRMIMFHMIADSHEELMAMAFKIGVKPKWIQSPSTAYEHFDVSKAKRALALSSGAVSITWRQCAAMAKRREVTGSLGSPKDAIAWLTHHYQKTRAIGKVQGNPK